MPNYTLDTNTRTLTHNGDILWNTGSLTWGTYTSWTTHTASADHTGVVGTPLYYQTDIIDLGSSQTVYPEINYSGNGDVRVVIEYHTSNSDLSGASFLGKYTTDNANNTSVVTYDVLDYQEAGYTNEDSSTNSNYTAFTARYVKFTAFVDKFDTATTRDIQTLENMNWALKTDTVSEQLNDIATSGLGGSDEARVIAFDQIGSIIQINITPHSQTNKKLEAQIVNKTNKTFRVLDSNSFSVAGVPATVDISATGIPGSLEASTEGIGLIT